MVGAALLCLFPLLTQAQGISGKERKRLIKELKNLYKNIEEYKEKKDQLALNRLAYQELDEKHSALKRQYAAQGEELTEYLTKEQQLRAEIDSLKKAIAEGSYQPNGENKAPSKYRIPTEETVFVVQFDVSTMKPARLDEKGTPVFSGDTDADGSRKYTLAYFKNEEDAQKFRKYLQSIDIPKVIVTKYQNGQKVK